MCPERATEPSSSDAFDQWYKKATLACAPFLFAESRYRNPWTDDELTNAVEVARRWHQQNPSPDPALDQHLEAILDAYMEMSVATVARVMEVREVIEVHAKAMDRRKLPRDQQGEPVPPGSPRPA